LVGLGYALTGVSTDRWLIVVGTVWLAGTDRAAQPPGIRGAAGDDARASQPQRPGVHAGDRRPRWFQERQRPARAPGRRRRAAAPRSAAARRAARRGLGRPA